jgi:hypothetical protein
MTVHATQSIGPFDFADSLIPASVDYDSPSGNITMSGAATRGVASGWRNAAFQAACFYFIARS